MQAKINKIVIANLTKGTIWDTEVEGLGVRWVSKKRKSWVLRYRTRLGDRRWLTLGKTATLSPYLARQIAYTHLRDIAQGGDPAQDIRSSRDELRFGALADEYMTRHSGPHKRSTDSDERRLRLHIRPALDTRRLSEVTPLRIAELRDSLSRGTGRKVLVLISSIWERGREWGRHQLPNPTKGVRRPPEVQRERWVTPTELPRLLEALDAEGRDHGSSVSGRICALLETSDRTVAELSSLLGARPNQIAQLVGALGAHGRACRVHTGCWRIGEPSKTQVRQRTAAVALWLYLLTGVRKRELLGLRWTDVDLDGGRVRVTGKTGPRWAPLSSAAVDVFKRLPRASEWVFPGRLGGHVKDLRATWSRVRTRAKLDDVTIHDLRRTFGSWLAESGESLLTIQSALGHASYRSTLIYARLSDDPARAAVERHGERLRALRESDE